MKIPTLSCLALVAAVICGPVAANTIAQSKATEQRSNQAAVVSQKRIDKSADKVLDARAEMVQLEQEIADLELYRDHLKGLVTSQQQEMTSLNTQLGEISQTRQGVVPLMYHMIDGLKRHIDQDLPLKQPQRQARLARLEALMSRADVSDAEKYRQILEAYQVELDYGTKLAVSQQPITLAGGEKIEAELLNLGRLSLVARSLDGQHFWLWQQQAGEWQPLESTQADDINQAYALAHKQVAPRILNLPLSVSAEVTQ